MAEESSWRDNPVVLLGRTWERDATGDFVVPKRTLGWHAVAWMRAHLKDPNSGDDQDKPLTLTPEQIRFILWWYRLGDNPGDGRHPYREGILQRRKGWGKDPLAAMLCMFELLGPCRFMMDDPKTGIPIGQQHPNPLVQVTATAKRQTKGVSSLIPALLPERTRRKYAISVSAEVVKARRGKATFQITGTSYRSLEGDRVTFSVLTEIHHFVPGNQGHEVYDTVRDNAHKLGNRVLSITNNYVPGRQSVLQRLRREYDLALQQGRDHHYYFDSLEASPDVPIEKEALEVVVPLVRGDAHWLDDADTVGSILSIATLHPSRARRMYLNQIAEDPDGLIPERLWSSLADESLRLAPGDVVTLGLDGSKSRDATALVAHRLKDNAVFLIGLWERDLDDGDWTVPRGEVMSAVASAHRRFKVLGFFADLAHWESAHVEWAEQWGPTYRVRALESAPVTFDMRKSQRSTEAHERLLATIGDGQLKHDGDSRLARHIAYVKRRENSTGVYFGKDERDPFALIDAYAAMLLAHEAAAKFRMKVTREPRQRVGGRVVM